MNYELTTYQNKPAIYCKESECFVLFGPKKKLEYRLRDLNNHFLKEGQRVRIIDSDDENGKFNRIFTIKGVIEPYKGILNGPYYVINDGPNEFTYIRSQLHLI